MADRRRYEQGKGALGKKTCLLSSPGGLKRGVDSRTPHDGKGKKDKNTEKGGKKVASPIGANREQKEELCYRKPPRRKANPLAQKKGVPDGGMLRRILAGSENSG